MLTISHYIPFPSPSPSLPKQKKYVISMKSKHLKKYVTLRFSLKDENCSNYFESYLKYRLFSQFRDWRVECCIVEVSLGMYRSIERAYWKRHIGECICKTGRFACYLPAARYTRSGRYKYRAKDEVSLCYRAGRR